MRCLQRDELEFQPKHENRDWRISKISKTFFRDRFKKLITYRSLKSFSFENTKNGVFNLSLLVKTQRNPKRKIWVNKPKKQHLERD